MRRDNELLHESLQRGGDERDLSLIELRAALTRNLRKALSSYARADESFLEDTVQDSLVRILDRLSQFEGRSQFVTWATTIAIRVAMSELRRHRWRDVSLEEVTSEISHGSQRSTELAAEVDLGNEKNAILEKLRDVIETQLTDKQRTALLAELKGMPQDRIAQQLGSSRNALYKLTHDARKKLKQGLEAAGFGADEIHSAFTK